MSDSRVVIPLKKEMRSIDYDINYEVQSGSVISIRWVPSWASDKTRTRRDENENENEMIQWREEKKKC